MQLNSTSEIHNAPTQHRMFVYTTLKIQLLMKSDMDLASSIVV